ncbi:MAG: hypothetical protein JW748_09275 [Anaerolineales bacterium]|nr:hypothetical protein [Anaerolineales bacterium]
MNENRNPIETRQESGEARSSEQQALDDATLEPRSYIEQTGDFQQAESIQATLVALVDSADSAMDISATPLPIPQPEKNSVLGSRPTIRGDLDQVTAGEDDGRHDATPITLPGKQEPAGATPITLPQMRAQPEEEEEGHPPEPPDLDHNPYPEETLKTSEDDSLRGRMPKIRGDLDQAIPIGSQNGGKNEATPINLPGPQAASVSAGITGDFGGDKVAAEDDWEAPNADRLAGNPESGFQKGSGGPVEFEKPILHKEMENLDSGLGKLDDLDALTPGPGKLGGAMGEKNTGNGLLGGMPGLESFKGGPSDLLKNNSGMGSGKGHEIPGWESPFPPGKGPNQWADTSAGGGKKAKTPGKGSNPGQGKPSGKQGQTGQSNQGSKVTVTHASVDKKGKVFFSDKETSSQSCETVKTAAIEHGVEGFNAGEEGSMDVDCGDGTHFFVAWSPDGVKGYKWWDESNNYSDPEMGHGKDPSQPLSSQMAYDKVNPKFDSGQISNYPEDRIAGGKGGGMLKEAQEKTIKRTLEHKAKLAHAAPKAGAEQITDPPEHDPGKKSETTGKGG